MQYKNIIWDWNGTLVNDVVHCVAILNEILDSFGFKKTNVDEYREEFGFPVKDYYVKRGFDFEKTSMQSISDIFHVGYEKAIDKFELQKDTIKVLESFKSHQITQYVLSAAEHNMLHVWVEKFELNRFFKDIYGIADTLGNSKVYRGKELMSAHDIDPGSSLYIGDSLHDFEVAEALGVDCILIAQGHQSFAKLSRSGTKVLSNLTSLPECLGLSN